MRCTHCGFENPADANFCQECGAGLPPACPACGRVSSPGAKFCAGCGAPMAAAAIRGAAQSASSSVPIQYTPRHLVERILAEQATMETRGSTVGERKTITALFADMAGSTALIRDLDPEDAQRLIDPVIALMMEAVHHYEGYVAKSLGDGILALFGAPLAHEDHAQRAVYAALRMQEAMRHHSDRVRLEFGIALQIRVGIHTGEVVVRSIRKDDLHADYDPVGHTVHIASRMESTATPATTLVSESTHKLTEGYFEFKALGTTRVKGLEDPLLVYEVVGPGPLRTRLQVAAHRGLARFVGRAAELAGLESAWGRARAGHGQIVGVVGEAGVGKSRLFLEFKARAQPGSSALVLETFSVSHGKAFAYLPLIELLKNYFQITPRDVERTCREKVVGKVLTLDRTLEELLPYVLYLFGIEEQGSALLAMDPQIRRERTFDAITRLLVRESVNQPVQVLFDDLQWLDRETEAFLNALIERVPNAGILLLLNFRPEYRPGWRQNSDYTQLRLDPLGQVESEALLITLLGEDTSLARLKRLILDKTDGNPFFMEEVVQTLVEESVLLGEPGRYRIEVAPDTFQIPTTVKGVLAARVDRLEPAEKALLQTLAVIGTEFTWSLVRQVAGQPEDRLRYLLAKLQASDFIYERPAFPEVEYAFKHSLTQEVAGQALLSEQRGALHERTAQAIEVLYRQQLDSHCSDLAHHYSLSGNIPKAVEYLHSAGSQALERSAHLEAIPHLNTALELLKRLPDTPERANQELALRITLGPALIAAKGYASPEVEASFSRALALSEQGGETRQIFQAKLGLRTFYSLRAEHQTSYKLGESLLSLAERAQDPELIGQANFALATSSFHLGDPVKAKAHLERGLATIDREHHTATSFLLGQDPVVHALVAAARVLWYLGCPDQAARRIQDALKLARKLSHPYSMALVLALAAEVYQCRREAQLVEEFSDAAIALSTEQGFPYWSAWGGILRGWALAEQGSPAEGIDQIHRGIRACIATGAELARPYVLALLAQAYVKAGQVPAALETLTEAQDTANRTGERYCLAELHRLRGELLLQCASDQSSKPSNDEEAQACFLEAISIAGKQGAKSLELRAMSSFARLSRDRGNAEAARQRLSATLYAFQEGLDTADWQEAKALLDALE
ncbi:adenylate/guanylate cyclase domain-containing protein [Paraburkholderia oxyphila]|uniref:adenylate/guanylate cyclase domain-containing protein n=1 Tax=Paraburkholderia oxyphila TaxID=614212 RepID=UPI0004874743|nr:adenylate/guanylate cyclase domain-containing protein [Paraburkholderia oxyphila]